MTRIRTAFARLDRGYLYSIGFLVAFVIVIETAFDWAALLEPWTELRATAIGGVLILLFLTYVARGLRLFRYYRCRLRFLTCLKVLLQHNLWIVLLPARTGEAAFPLLMHRYFGISLRESLPVLLWFRFLDMHTLVLIVASVFLWRQSPLVSVFFAAGWSGSLVAVLLSRPLVVRFLESRPGRVTGKLLAMLTSAPFSMSRFVETWVWTLVGWTTKLLLFAWIIGAFTSLNFLPSLLGALGGEVSSALPIHSIGGFGTYHSGVATALLPFGASLNEAIRGGVNLHLVVFGGAIASGLLAYAIPGIDANRKRRMTSGVVPESRHVGSR